MMHEQTRLQCPRGSDIQQSGLRSMKDVSVGQLDLDIWPNLVDPYNSSSNYGPKGMLGCVGGLVHTIE